MHVPEQIKTCGSVCSNASRTASNLRHMVQMNQQARKLKHRHLMLFMAATMGFLYLSIFNHMLTIFYVCILLPCVQFLHMLLSLIISLYRRYLQLRIWLWCTRTMGLFVFIFIVSSTAHVALNIMQSASLTISAWVVSLSTFSTRTLTTDSIFTIWWMMVDMSMWYFVEYPMLLLYRAKHRSSTCEITVNVLTMLHSNALFCFFSNAFSCGYNMQKLLYAMPVI